MWLCMTMNHALPLICRSGKENGFRYSTTRKKAHTDTHSCTNADAVVSIRKNHAVYDHKCNTSYSFGRVHILYRHTRLSFVCTTKESITSPFKAPTSLNGNHRNKLPLSRLEMVVLFTFSPYCFFLHCTPF